MNGTGLLRALQAGFAAKRQLDAFLTAGAGQLAHLSRPELGPESLAKQNGWGTAPGNPYPPQLPGITSHSRTVTSRARSSRNGGPPRPQIDAQSAFGRGHHFDDVGKERMLRLESAN
jgi:hypothetical protein